MDDRFPGGHGNNGMAHEIGSVLALLALGARRAITVNDRAGPGLLDGAAGIALAVHSAASAVPPRNGWDACLLIA
ncbi:hypothetical protein [Streptomyces sp. Root1310]|uniref:hypothetical protein n=1 Tax=Streptomyces sp. Root1310 TaxID=1736452 RepID=UPI00070BCF2D|nr:hypothetical protein [Streptomyces sp. Root1310]KQX77084.1 hypothetical protein ASD48_38540 [Streptomyces sp. Root1310]